MMRTTRRTFLAAPALLAAAAARAEAAPWVVVTEYPPSSMPGEGVAHFAGAASRLGVPVGVAPRPGATPSAMTGGPESYRSAAAFNTLSVGRYAVADAFAGAIGTTDPLFLLSSLPFLTASHADAARLRDLARPHYAAAAQAHGAMLLWSTPWPPSGLWTRRPVTAPGDLAGLHVRTYDRTGTEVLRAAGAHAEVLSFAGVERRLADGTLDGVLSSGDGGAGRRLWRWLPHFTEINYAWPLSLAFAARLHMEELSEEKRNAVMQAARETEARQWRAIEGRLEANRRVMRENDVSIHAPAPALQAALREAASSATEAWQARAGEAGRAILAAYRAT